MRQRLGRRTRLVLVAMVAGWLCQTSCITNVEREIEVLRAPLSSPSILGQSVLLDLFGPQILKLF
jgi:hypothetical protein